MCAGGPNVKQQFCSTVSYNPYVAINLIHFYLIPSVSSNGDSDAPSEIDPSGSDVPSEVCDQQRPSAIQNSSSDESKVYDRDGQKAEKEIKCLCVILSLC